MNFAAKSKALVSLVYGDLLCAGHVNWRRGAGVRLKAARLLSWQLQSGAVYGVQFHPNVPRVGLLRVQGGFLVDGRLGVFKELPWEDTLLLSDSIAESKERILLRLESDVRKHLLDFSSRIKQYAEELRPGDFSSYDLSPSANAEMGLANVG